ncbi:MAG TPA: sulfatase [Kofleriaceae bacterium]|nr:sulfatase [Kofleriaceae bacterium]
MRLCVLLLAVACSGSSGTGATSRPPARGADRRPNILFLISDDHSAGDLGALGNAALRTPALDALAAGGVRFTSAYTTSPQCSPSRAAIATGRSPHATGTSRLHATLTGEHATVIDSLKRAGYHVAALRKVHLGVPFQRRWDRYGGDDARFEDFFRDRPRDRPFFLWIGFHDPHRPYDPAPPATGIRVPAFLPDTPAVRGDLAAYHAEIERMDGEIAAVLALLDREGLTASTLVMFAGDNGMPFPGAKGSLHDPGVRVPLLARWPGRIEPGGTRDDPVSLLDLAPTWLEAAGLPVDPRMEGRSLLGAPAADRAVFFERNWHDNLDLVRGVRRGRLLLLHNFRPELPYRPSDDLAGSPSWRSIEALHAQKKLAPALERRYFAAPRPEVELYDLAGDPLRDLAADPARAADVRSLEQALSDWMVATSDFLPPPIPPPLGEHGETVHPGH